MVISGPDIVGKQQQSVHWARYFSKAPQGAAGIVSRLLPTSSPQAD
jgi:hypothetical protein